MTQNNDLDLKGVYPENNSSNITRGFNLALPPAAIKVGDGSNSTLPPAAAAATTKRSNVFGRISNWFQSKKKPPNYEELSINNKLLDIKADINDLLQNLTKILNTDPTKFTYVEERQIVEWLISWVNQWVKDCDRIITKDNKTHTPQSIIDKYNNSIKLIKELIKNLRQIIDLDPARENLKTYEEEFKKFGENAQIDIERRKTQLLSYPNQTETETTKTINDLYVLYNDDAKIKQDMLTAILKLIDELTPMINLKIMLIIQNLTTLSTTITGYLKKLNKTKSDLETQIQKSDTITHESNIQNKTYKTVNALYLGIVKKHKYSSTTSIPLEMLNEIKTIPTVWHLIDPSMKFNKIYTELQQAINARYKNLELNNKNKNINNKDADNKHAEILTIPLLELDGGKLRKKINKKKRQTIKKSKTNRKTSNKKTK